MPEDRLQNDKGYSLAFKEDGVYLTVFKPLDYLPPVNEDDIISAVRRKKIKNYHANLIKEAVISSDGNPVKIAEAQEEEVTDAFVEAIVSQDKMTAYVLIRPPEGNGAPPNLESIVQALYSKGVVF